MFRYLRLRLQVKFKAKAVPASVRQERLPALQAAQQLRSATARADAQRKLHDVNAEFAAAQGRVAAAMAAACAPFVGTVEDNVACALPARLSCCDAASLPSSHVRRLCVVGMFGSTDRE